MSTASKVESRMRRRRRIRKHVSGEPDRPRLTVFRSNKHIYAQVIDDVSQRALAAVSTKNRDVVANLAGLDKTAQAKVVGQAIAAACAKAGITKVVFDRNGYAYHGRVSSLAAGAREGGLEF